MMNYFALFKTLMETDFQNDMKKFQLQCPPCSEADQLKKHEVKLHRFSLVLFDHRLLFYEHLQELNRNPTYKFCHAQSESMDQGEMHKKSECTQIPVPCALKEYGCVDSVSIDIKHSFTCLLSQNYSAAKHMDIIK